jgi:hypothetical protein
MSEENRTVGGIDHNPNDWWKPQHIDEPEMADLLEQRMEDSVADLARMLNESLYGDHGASPPTRGQLFRWRWRERLGRIRDALDVLLGRAHVE